MTPSLIEALGYAAGMLTTLAFVPQVIKTWRSQSADDLSGTTLVAFSVGLLLWLVYGVVVESWPLVLSNAVTLGLTGTLMVCKMRLPPHGE